MKLKHERKNICATALRFGAGALTALTIFISGAAAARADTLAPPETVSEAYCVMDSATGQVVLQKNMDKTEFPASITKVLTAALVLERLDPADRYTFSAEAASYDITGTHLAMVEGEEFSVEDLLCGMMLASANDAAQGLAEAAAGSQEAFIALMNAKAAELGATESNFTNPSGYHDPALVSTAHDMALLTRWALTVEGFRDYFGRWDYVIGPTNVKSESRNLGTYHSMIVGPENNPVFGYEGATGGKLGWTPEATHTIVTVAERDGVELICVALKSTDQYAKYRDSMALFDYVFENFEYISLPVGRDTIDVTDGGGEAGVLTLGAAKALAPGGTYPSAFSVEPLPETLDISQAGAAVTLRVSTHGAGGAMERSFTVDVPAEFTEETKPALAPAAESETEKEELPLWAKLLIGAAAVLILVAAAVLIIRACNIRRYRRLRAKSRRKWTGEN